MVYIGSMNGIFEVLGLRSSQLSTSFPPLPIELVRYVMEIAAAEHHKTAVGLSLVSKDVHDWTAPFLYRTVILPTPERLLSFHSILIASRPTVASQVKSLFLRSMSNSSGHRATEILSTCTEVERLVVDSLYRQPAVDQSLPWPTPWEVIFIYGAASWLQRGHPSLQHVTHIHLDRILFNTTLDACIGLPRLTHLGITHLHVASDNDVYDDNFVRLIRRSLSLGQSLEIVFVQLQPRPSLSDEESHRRFSGRIWKELAKIEDPRLLARPALEPEDYSKALETGATIWDNASTQFVDWRVFATSHRE